MMMTLICSTCRAQRHPYPLSSRLLLRAQEPPAIGTAKHDG
ncbi:hypothetical protein PANA5342_3886 [Pantoea ananatis LMG 5342]|nr:hypothetical protein PANA5342_3886 [Pantoea ananatis LMG 5342]